MLPIYRTSISFISRFPLSAMLSSSLNTVFCLALVATSTFSVIDARFVRVHEKRSLSHGAHQDRAISAQLHPRRPVGPHLGFAANADTITQKTAADSKEKRSPQFRSGLAANPNVKTNKNATQASTKKRSFKASPHVLPLKSAIQKRDQSLHPAMYFQQHMVGYAQRTSEPDSGLYI